MVEGVAVDVFRECSDYVDDPLAVIELRSGCTFHLNLRLLNVDTLEPLLLLSAAERPCTLLD